MSDKSSALRAKSDDGGALHMRLPFGFTRPSAASSLLVAQMAHAIQRFSRLAGTLGRVNGAAYPAVAGH
jgi:hypothetical protein